MDTQQNARSRAADLYEWFESVAFALTLTLLILVFGFNFSRVSGTSMVPTLADGDRVVVRTAFYTPQRGDIITTDTWISYGKPLVKRVIGLPGDVVDIDAATGRVSVNGSVLDETYISSDTTLAGDVAMPFTVPAGSVFVMGDNRPRSLDSRYAAVGCVDMRDILGKIIWRISPRMGRVS